jgi:hypothetical protein
MMHGRRTLCGLLLPLLLLLQSQSITAKPVMTVDRAREILKNCPLSKGPVREKLGIGGGGSWMHDASVAFLCHRHSKPEAAGQTPTTDIDKAKHDLVDERLRTSPGVVAAVWGGRPWIISTLQTNARTKEVETPYNVNANARMSMGDIIEPEFSHGECGRERERGRCQRAA